MKIFSVTNIDLSDFVVGRFTYSRNDNQLGTMIEAIQVTPENIGMLAIDFEADLWYTGSGDPYFKIWVERIPENEKILDPRHLVVQPSDWLLPLRGEIHLFRHYQFIHTFEPNGPITHHPMRVEFAEQPQISHEEDVLAPLRRKLSEPAHSMLGDESAGTLQPLADNLLVEITAGVWKGKTGVINRFNDHMRSYEIQLDDQSGGDLVAVPEDAVQQYP